MVTLMRVSFRASVKVADAARGMSRSPTSGRYWPVFTRRLMVGLVAVSVALIASCGPAKPDRKPTPAPSPSASPSTSPRAAAERDALTAYSGMWQAMAKAGEVPDPDAPELRQYATDQALARIVSALFTYRQTGVVTHGAPTTNARVSGVTPADVPTEVRVVDCADSTNWTKHKKATGELIKDDPRGRRNITAVVKSVDGSWKVTSFDVGDIGSC